MKRILFLFLVLLAGTAPVSSCKNKKKAAKETVVQEEPKRDYAAEGYEKATVSATDLDGCKFLLQIANDPAGADVMKQLEPSNLKEEFKKDQLAVWVKYTPKKGAMSTCMAGPVVEITDMQLRK